MSVKNFLLVIICLLTFSSCKKGKQDEPKSNVDVYIAGTSYTIDGFTTATYWKNGTAIKLSPSTPTTSASGIAVVGNDVYVCGTIRNPSNPSQSNAIYWKNGVEHKLEEGGSTSIKVINGDVYLSGVVMDNMLKTQLACYWKNGVITKMDRGTNVYTSASDIAVKGSDVYLAGHIGVGDIQAGYISTIAPAYWKNGTERFLTLVTNDLNTCVARKMLFEGNDLLIAGEVSRYNESRLATYWKNNAEVKVATTNSSANAITINNGDIYLGGYNIPSVNKQTACYWKNGVLTNISNVPDWYNIIQSPEVKTIAFNGNDQYMLFNRSHSYWLNGNLVRFSADDKVDTYAMLLVAK